MDRHVTLSPVLSTENPIGYGTVLLIEDEADVVGVVERVLAAHRYRVQTAVTGQEGLRQAKEGAIEAIVMDALLPDVGGFDLCRALRGNERTRRIPIVILTALASDQDRVRAFDAGADYCVSKLFSLRDLPTRIQKLVGRTWRTPPVSQRPSAIALLPTPVTR